MFNYWKNPLLLLLILSYWTPRTSAGSSLTNCTSFILTADDSSIREYQLKPMKPLPVIPGQPLHLFSLFQHHQDEDQDQNRGVKCTPFRLSVSDSKYDLMATCGGKVLFRVVYGRKRNGVLCTGYDGRSAGSKQDCGFQDSVQLTTIDRDWLFLEDLSTDVPRGSWVLFRMEERGEYQQRGCDCEKIRQLVVGIGSCENDLDHQVQTKTLFLQRLLAGTIGLGVVLGISVFALRGVYSI